jgi:hypothetical protein
MRVVINGEAGGPVHRSVRVKLILAKKPDFKIRFAAKNMRVSEFSNPGKNIRGTEFPCPTGSMKSHEEKEIFKRKYFINTQHQPPTRKKKEKRYPEPCTIVDS